MTLILTTVAIPRPIETVFDYVTTPATWPMWHPSSEGVRGAIDHSLQVGEQRALPGRRRLAGTSAGGEEGGLDERSASLRRLRCCGYAWNKKRCSLDFVTASFRQNDAHG